MFEKEIGYSRAVVCGPWIFVSGTTGFDYSGMTISESVTQQTEQCLTNIESALQHAGRESEKRGPRHLRAAQRRRFPAVLADPAEVLRRGPTGRDDDFCGARRSADED